MKELKKRNYLVSIELEKRGNILEKLSEENKTLETKNNEYLKGTLTLMKSRENDIEIFLIKADEKHIKIESNINDIKKSNKSK